jgi:hypothetical protein
LATSITINVIDGADFTEDGASGLLNSRGTKLCYVDGVDGDDDALLTAMTLVQARFQPFKTPYSPRRPWCVPISYKPEGVAEDSGAVRVRVFFGTPSYGRKRVQGVPWVKEEQSTFEMVSSQLDPDTGEPIVLTWTNPKDNAQKAEDIGHYSYPQLIRRVSLSGILRFDEIENLRKISRKVNEQPWSKQKKGYWRCTRVADRLILGQQLTQVVIELDTKEEDGDWSTYEILKDQRDGKYKADPDACKKLKKADYKFGVQNPVGGGVAKIGAYRLGDFSGILGFDDVDKLNTFSAAAKLGLTK